MSSENKVDFMLFSLNMSKHLAKVEMGLSRCKSRVNLKVGKFHSSSKRKCHFSSISSDESPLPRYKSQWTEREQKEEEFFNTSSSLYRRRWVAKRQKKTPSCSARFIDRETSAFFLLSATVSSSPLFTLTPAIVCKLLSEKERREIN